MKVGQLITLRLESLNTDEKYFILNCFILSSQTINLNEINIINDLRIEQISE